MNEYGLGEKWEYIIKKIEETAKQYSKVNRAISFGLSEKLRVRAAKTLSSQKIIVDAGCGPGDMTLRIIDKTRFRSYIVGLDADFNLLKVLENKLDPVSICCIDLVVGIFEEMPLREEAVNAVVTSYSLRDAINLRKALSEIHRILKKQGVFIDVDIGNPNNRIIREAFTKFLRFVTPVIASFYYGSIRNPWSKLYKTIENMPINKTLLKIIKRYYQKAELEEVALGGLIKIVAFK